MKNPFAFFLNSFMTTLLFEYINKVGQLVNSLIGLCEPNHFILYIKIII